MEIHITDYQGVEHEGTWNGKTYSSNIDGCGDLVRVYINNNVVHCKKEDIENVGANVEADKMRRKLNQISEFISKLTDEEKEFVLGELLQTNEILRQYLKNQRDCSIKEIKEIESIIYR